SSFFSSVIRSAPSSSLFPYTTLFRSRHLPPRPCHLCPLGFRFPVLLQPTNLVSVEYEVHLPQSALGSFTNGVTRFVGWSRTGKRSEEHTSELQSRGHLVCRLLLGKKN